MSKRKAGTRTAKGESKPLIAIAESLGEYASMMFAGYRAGGRNGTTSV